MANDNKKTLLLVEDEAIIALAQKMSLEKYGYAVITANSGEKAFDIFKSSNIDLVLMDIDLGRGIDGTETAKMILRECQVPIVFLSSHTEPYIVEKTEKITSYGYIVKNSGITVLDASIKMAFKLFDANRQLLESEIKQKAMIANISDVISVIAKDGTLKYNSPNIEKWFGWHPDKIQGCNGWAVVHPEDLDRIHELFSKITEKDNFTQTSEFRYKCSDGSYKPVEFTAINLADDPVIGGVLVNYHDITERRKAGEALRESEERFRKIFDEGHSGIVIVNKNFNFETVNRAFCTFTGYSSSELATMTFKDITHPDHVKQDSENIIKLMNGEIAFYQTEKRYIRKNGEVLWGDLVVSAIHNNEGEFLYFLSIVEDISERKLAESILKESESLKSELFEKLNTAQKIAQIGSWEWDLKTDKVWWSDESYRIFGVTKGEYTPSFEGNGKFIHPDDIEQYGVQFDNCFKYGTPLDYEFRLLAGDGLMKYCNARGEIVYDNNGNPVRFNGTVHDITMRRLAEDEIKTKKEELEALNEELNATLEEMEASNDELIESNRVLIEMDSKLADAMAVLRNNELHLRTLLRTIPDLVWLKDKDGRYLLCNAVFERFFGAKEQDIAGKTDYDFMSSELAEFFLENDRKAIEGGKPTANEEWVTFADDNHRAMLETIKTPVYDENRNLLGVLGIGRDITDRKRIEEELNYNRNLLKTVFDSASEAIYAKDIKGQYHVVNNACLQLLGFTSSEILGRRDIDILPADLADEFIKTDEAVIKNGQVEEREESGIIQGRMCTFLSHKAPWRDSSGNIIGIIGVSTDITDRKKAETELKEKSEKLESLNEELNATLEELESLNGDLAGNYEELQGKERALLDEKIFTEALFESIPGHLYVYDENLQLIRWNRKHETVTGYSAEELSHMHISRFFEGDDIARVEKTANEVFTTGYGEIEAHIVLKNGGKILVHLSGVRMLLEGKIYLTGVGIDITESKRIENELRESEKKYRILTENIKDVVWILDTKTMYFLYVSPSVRHLRGYTAEEILALPVDAAMAPGASEFLLNLIQRRSDEILSGEKESGEFYINEVEQPCKNGSTVWTEVITSYYINDKTGHVEVRGVTRDITERRKAEERIRTLLAEKELLLKEVHHRIRNFMNTINSLLILQASTLKDPAVIRVLEEAGNRLQCMMLLYDKLYHSADFKKVSVMDYITSLVNEILAGFPDSNLVKTDIKIDDFVLDAKRLQSLGIIINELLTNIMKYAFNSTGGMLISIYLALSGSRVTFIIHDNGIGMPESIDFGNSTGFGLILVDMLAKQLKGAIRLERCEGTRFILEFDI